MMADGKVLICKTINFEVLKLFSKFRKKKIGLIESVRKMNESDWIVSPLLPSNVITIRSIVNI